MTFVLVVLLIAAALWIRIQWATINDLKRTVNDCYDTLVMFRKRDGEISVSQLLVILESKMMHEIKR